MSEPTFTDISQPPSPLAEIHATISKAKRAYAKRAHWDGQDRELSMYMLTVLEQLAEAVAVQQATIDLMGARTRKEEGRAV